MKRSQRAAQTPAAPPPSSSASADPATTALLAAAREIFEAGGFPALSVRRVAEAAGCTTMQVYSRLGGKDGLLQALFDEGFEALSSAQQGVPEAFPAEERVRRLCHEYLRIAAERPHHYALMLGAHSCDFKPPQASQARALATLAHLVDAVGNALPPMQDRELRAREVAHQILAFWRIGGPSWRIDITTFVSDAAVSGPPRPRRLLPQGAERSQGGSRPWSAGQAGSRGERLFAVAWVYRELPRVYFAADDFLNLFQIVNRPLLEYLLQSHGGHILVTRNALFLLFHLLFGTAAESFQCVVLVTHLVNVALLFRVIRRLTLSPHLAAFGATLWGICPVHADALGWYSVYGHVVVGTILLCLLDRASRATREGTPPASASVVLWPLLLLLASTSFGVGIGIAAVSPAVFFLILPPSRQRTALCMVLAAAVVALPFLYDALLSLHGSLTGKLLARPSVMANLFPALRYWELTGLMTAYLLEFGVAGLLFGFFRIDATFPTAFSAAAAVVFAAAVLLVLVRADAVTRRWIVALLLVVVATYGIIAVGRANFFLSSTMGKAAMAGRYHYVATMPLALLLCLLLARIGDAVALRGGAGLAVLAIWARLTGLGYARAPRLLDLHDWQRRETMSVLQALADMAASNSSPKLYIANRRFQAAGVFISRHEMQFPGWAAIYTIFFPANELLGKQVRFVVEDPAVAAALQDGRRTAGLVVARDRVPDGETVLTPKPLAASEAVP